MLIHKDSYSKSIFTYKHIFRLEVSSEIVLSSVFIDYIYILFIFMYQPFNEEIIKE